MMPARHFTSWANTTSSAIESRPIAFNQRAGASLSVADSQPTLLNEIWTAKAAASADNWDGDGAVPISEVTTTNAVQLVCALPEGLRRPSITAEPTGEIAFEWYRDNRHVAVLTVQDQTIRWSTLIGDSPPRHGRQYFSRSVPPFVVDAIVDVFS